jgi:hypothetical protein
MIISHGTDEKVLGYDYCKNKVKEDFIEIQKIVDIFSEKNRTTLILSLEIVTYHIIS